LHKNCRKLTVQKQVSYSTGHDKIISLIHSL
jgi:hypothetical protein